MTGQKKAKERSGNRMSGILLFVGTLGVFFCLLFGTDIAIGAVRHGLSVCARTVIPSLFPFMVLSGLLVELGTADLLAPIFALPMKFLFGISGVGCAAPVMGALCGFPVGALAAVKLYEKKKIDVEELERLLVVSSNPSSAFLISAVGTSLWSCSRFGVVLYIVQLLTAICVGVIFRLVCPIKNAEKKTELVSGVSDISFRTSLTRAVNDAALSMLNVCAFVLFFAAVCSALIGLTERFGVGQTAKSLVYGFFEMSGAVCESAKIRPAETGLVVSAAICGWSGLSVHFQVMSLCRDRRVNFLPYICGKALQSVLSAFFVFLYVRFIDRSLILTCVPVFTLQNDGKITLFAVLSTVLFAVSLVSFSIEKITAAKK